MAPMMFDEEPLSFDEILSSRPETLGHDQRIGPIAIASPDGELGAAKSFSFGPEAANCARARIQWSLVERERPGADVAGGDCILDR
jgi:hypothetical protein